MAFKCRTLKVKINIHISYTFKIVYFLTENTLSVHYQNPSLDIELGLITFYCWIQATHITIICGKIAIFINVTSCIETNLTSVVELWVKRNNSVGEKKTKIQIMINKIHFMSQGFRFLIAILVSPCLHFLTSSK
jgi:hypothetical protein